MKTLLNFNKSKVTTFDGGKILVSITFGLLFVTSFSFLLLTSFSSSAVASCSTDSEGNRYCADSANASVTVTAACTMSATIDTPHTATLNPGVNQTDIGQTTLKVICNDAAGYSIYAVGFTGDEIGGANSTKLVGPSSAIATGTSTSGNTSSWSMKVSPVQTSTFVPTIYNNFSDYHDVPSTYTKVASYPSATVIPSNPSSADPAASNTGSSITTTYAAYAAPTEAPGSYNGKVKYTMVHPASKVPAAPLLPSDCPANSICYAPNANDIVGSMSSLGSISASATAGKKSASSNSTAELVAPNFSRSGYGFAGWSTDFEATNASTIYGPNETITTGDLSTNGMILYPVWIASSGNLQNWTGCSSLTQASYNTTTGELSATLSSMTALTDERDGNVYTVARLADGLCWMTENLRLDAENSDDSTLAQGFAGVFTGLDSSENTNFSNTTNATPNNKYSGDNVTGNYNGYRIPRYNNNNTNRNLTPNYSGTGSTTYYQWYSYGNYYSWAAALANTNHYSGPTATVDGKTSETAGTSLCPTGWKLPYGRDTGSGITAGGFSNLDQQMGGTGASSSTNAVTGLTMSRYWRQFPNNFVYSGYFGGSSANYRSSYGGYWSSTADNNYHSYYLSLNSSGVGPGANNDDKYNGRSVRCILGS